MAYDSDLGTNDKWSPIYVNNVKRLCTGIDLVFYVDSDELPKRRCSRHGLNRAAAHHLLQGGRVFTSGNWYSLHPHKEQS